MSPLHHAELHWTPRTVLLLIALVAVATVAGLSRLHTTSTRAQQAVTVLARVESRLYAMSNLEWATQGESASTSTLVTHAALTRELSRLLHDYRTLVPRAARHSPLETLAARYSVVTRDQLGLLRAGKRDAAERFDGERVDPLFEELASRIDAESSQLSAYAAHVDRWTTYAEWACSAMALLLIGLLLVRFSMIQSAYARQQAALASERRYRLLFEGNPHPMWVADRGDGALLAANLAACELYGYTRAELETRRDRDLAAEGAAPFPPLGEDGVSSGLTRHRGHGGREVDVEVDAHAIEYNGHDAVLVFAVDVSERLRLEEQARQSQKMEAIGRLAGGVAHDFNNLLTVILGHTMRLAAKAAPDSADARSLAAIGEASERAARLTRQLLAFGRQQLVVPEVVNPAAVTHESASLLARLLPDRVALAIDCDDEIGEIVCDPMQLEQVLMNLVTNACEAMNEGGTVRVSLGRATLSDEAARLGVPAGEYVALTVADSGCGMDEETLRRAFEPFFTRKEKSRGSGLGLATVYAIVQQAGGAVTLDSAPGAGTTARVFFPRHAAVATRAAAA